MNRLRWGGALAAAFAGMLTIAPWHAQAAAPLQAGCQIQTGNSQIKRVLFLSFDNVHLRRDNGRPYPQGRQAGGPASSAVEQVRAVDQR
jgi:hypothetical protein